MRDTPSTRRDRTVRWNPCMLMLSALKDRAIARLWFGQAMSSIGDEVYRVGLTWLAVGIIGADTGYLAAGQAAALMILSFVGGKWADRWEPVRTMGRVDLIRAAIVLLPVLVSFFIPVPLWLLVVVALTLSALAAFFDPALQTMLPQLAPEPTVLRATTGLMSTTIRLARMVGPGLIGFLAGVIPTIHFLTLNAISFVVSALSVRPLKVPHTASPHAPQSFTQAIAADFRTVRAEPGMNYVMVSKALTGGTWNLAVMLGFALLVQQLAPSDVRAYGLVIAAYGTGNIAGALYFGNHPRPRPGFLMFAGYAWLGLGFILIGCSPTIRWIMLCAAFSGFGGPMNDLAFSDLVQARFSITDIPRVFRLRIAVEMGATLLCTAISPTLFRLLSVRGTIVLCGVVWAVVGAYGLMQLESFGAVRPVARREPVLPVEPQ